MDKEELRENIAKIIIHNCRFINYCGRAAIMDDKQINALADALIAAGLTFDGEWKHRAEVAERAARDLIAYYCSYTIENDIDNGLRVALQQAEKELTEEKKE